MSTGKAILPAGKGFADLVFLPRKNHLDKPAMIIELKWINPLIGQLCKLKTENTQKPYTISKSIFYWSVLTMIKNRKNTNVK